MPKLCLIREERIFFGVLFAVSMKQNPFRLYKNNAFDAKNFMTTKSGISIKCAFLTSKNNKYESTAYQGGNSNKSSRGLISLHHQRASKCHLSHFVQFCESARNLMRNLPFYCPYQKHVVQCQICFSCV